MNTTIMVWILMTAMPSDSSGIWNQSYGYSATVVYSPAVATQEDCNRFRDNMPQSVQSRSTCVQVKVPVTK
jgi:hypothetical protein